MKPDFSAFKDSEGNPIKIITTQKELDEFLKRSKEAFKKLPFWNRLLFKLFTLKNKIL